MKSPTIPRPFAALLLSIALAACDGKSSPTKENFAKAVQTYFDSKDAVCIFTGAVPFDAARYSYEERSAEPLVQLGLLTKEPTSVQDDGSAHRMVPGFHFALTDEGKKSYRPANPAKESKICGGKAKLLAIAQATSASDKPNVGDRVLVRFEGCHCSKRRSANISALSAKADGWTRAISRSKASGSICIAQLIRRATPSIFYSGPDGTRSPPVAFRKGIAQNGAPETVTIDKSGANLAALQAVNAERETPIKVRQIKYLNNIVAQDHRVIKRRTGPMLGLKDFHCARIILGGIETMHMIRKGQMQSVGKSPLFAPQQFYSIIS